jgi:hypothetical protein
MPWIFYNSSGQQVGPGNVGEYGVYVYPATGVSYTVTGTTNTFVGINNAAIVSGILPASVGAGMVVAFQDWGGNATAANQIAITVTGGGTIKGESVISVPNMLLKFVDTPNGWSSQ